MNTIEQAIKDFLNYCKYEKNLSPKTIKAYQIDLTQFNLFLKNKYSLQTITDITKFEIRAYLENISPMKPKSIKRKIATLKAMFNFLEFDDRVVINPIRKTRISIKEPKLLPKVMTQEEILRIMTIAYKDLNSITTAHTFAYFEKIRNVAIIELLFTTGSRVSEIAELKINQVDLKTGSIVLKGKGNKERIIQVCSIEAIKTLRRYMEAANVIVKKRKDSFLINRFGNQISDQSIRSIVKRYSAAAKINRSITPHIFRHTFATLLLEKDVDIKYIQSLLGHSSIMTTQIYTHVNQKKQRKILSAKHPRMDKVFQEISTK